MENDLFGDPPAPPVSQPVSVIAVLETALPMTYFLVSFARREVQRFKGRHKREIIHAIVEFASPVMAISTADIEWWITEGLPKAGQIYRPIEELAAAMDARAAWIARRAAINIVGPSRSPNRLRCLELIDRLFPVTTGPGGMVLL